MRVKFNTSGQQRLFFDYIKKTTGISLRKLCKKEKLNYELLKKYKQEKCFISKDIFYKLCKISNIKPEELEVSYLDNYWGQVKGGKS